MDSAPKVSICVPNLNTRSFLAERFESIFAQSFQDWEIIVSDNYSDDGAWEFLLELASKDERIHLAQAPREGMYANWNNCIRCARGRYVYIATSDDTMAPDCLERLVEALDGRSDCGLAHCCLTFIDANGAPIVEGNSWENWATTRYLGDWIGKPHVRDKGHDTILNLVLGTAYYSITQLLIRRSIFDEAGLFRSDWGSCGDLEWQMRASLVTNTVHVPEYLATWRVHPEQATQSTKYLQAVSAGTFVRMADEIIDFSKKHGAARPRGLPRRLRRFKWNEYVQARMASRKERFSTLAFMLRELASSLPEVLRHYKSRLLGRGLSNSTAVADELRRLKISGPREVECMSAVASS